MGSEKGGDVELRACPFCGDVPDAAEETIFPTDQGTKWGRVECWCGARGPEVRTGYAPWTEWKDEAIAAWNRRAALQDVQTGEEDWVVKAIRGRYEGWESEAGKAVSVEVYRADVGDLLSRLSGPVQGGRE